MDHRGAIRVARRLDVENGAFRQEREQGAIQPRYGGCRRKPV
jgi:hypothetical protein